MSLLLHYQIIYSIIIQQMKKSLAEFLKRPVSAADGHARSPLRLWENDDGLVASDPVTWSRWMATWITCLQYFALCVGNVVYVPRYQQR